MGWCVIASPSSRVIANSNSIVPFALSRFSTSRGVIVSAKPLNHGFSGRALSTLSFRKGCSTKAILSEADQKKYVRVGADSTGPIPSDHLLDVIESAAKTGAQVVMDAVNKPRSITYKGLTDLVTDTDKMSEAAILDVVKNNFQDHLILGEEGGVIGNSSSDYLWCIDPLDGTTNFAHGYPSFAVSAGVLYKGKPAAATVVSEIKLYKLFKLLPRSKNRIVNSCY